MTSPLTSIEVQMTMTPATMVQLVLVCVIIFLLYFIIKNQLA